MSKKTTGRRGRQANIVGAASATVGFGGIATTSSVSPVERAGNATANPLLSSGSSSREDIGIVVKQTGGSSSGSGSSTPSTPSTPTTPTTTTTTPAKVGVTTGPTVTPTTPTTTTTTTTTTTPTQTKVVVDPNANTTVRPTTPTTPTTPVKVGVTDGPTVNDNVEKEKEEDMDTKPGFNGLDEDDTMKDDSIVENLKNGFDEERNGQILPAIPPAGNIDRAPVGVGDGEQPETALEPAKTGKSKKWLIVIVAGIVLWLLFKKRK